MNKGFNDLWPTKVYLGEIDKNINDLVYEKLLLEIHFNGNFKEDVSENPKFDILNNGSETFQTFRDVVVWPAFTRYLDNIDININEFPDRKLKSWISPPYNGYSITVHNHVGSTLSAIFYILCEETNRGGELLLLDSRLNANRGYKPQFKKLFENKTYFPKTGEYIIFPGHVYHHTTVFTGHIRMAIPVDLFL